VVHELQFILFKSFSRIITRVIYNQLYHILSNELFKLSICMRDLFLLKIFKAFEYQQ